MAREKRMEFVGTGLQALGWSMVSLLLTILVIPAAWGAVYLYKWIVRNLAFSDGTTASFEGRGKEVWHYFIVTTLLGQVFRVAEHIDDPTMELITMPVLMILVFTVNSYFWLKIMRWGFSSIKTSCGTELDFTGTYWAFLGWQLLIMVSVVTIIGWAWASVAMWRWICNNIEADQKRFAFLGSGWGFLWRFVPAFFASFLIIPIPWVWLWVARWAVRNVEILDFEALPSSEDEVPQIKQYGPGPAAV